jgi:hypothetical protein
MPKLSAQARARKIKLLLFVDGVLSDGKLFIFPAPTGSQPSVLQQSPSTAAGAEVCTARA